jgi:hypothetical protein
VNEGGDAKKFTSTFYIVIVEEVVIQYIVLIDFSYSTHNVPNKSGKNNLLLGFTVSRVEYHASYEELTDILHVVDLYV